MDASPAPVTHPSKSAARWPLPAILLVGLALVAAGIGMRTELPLATRLAVTSGVVLVAAVWLLAAWLRGRWLPPLLDLLEQHTDALDALPDRGIGWWIALASGAGLFAELVLIRWHASCFQLFAYYKNVSLLAAFLGLGIGYAYGNRRPVLTPLVLPALAAQFVLLFWLRFSPLQGFLQNPVAETVAFGMSNVGYLGQATLCYGFLLVVFAFTVLTCIPLGHLASRLMRRRPPLVAYSWNLLGSLAGIGLFSLLCYAWTPPAVWLIVTVLGLVPFLLLGRSRLLAGVGLVAAGVALAALAMPLRTDLIDVYSPYQILSLNVERGQLPFLQVNHVYFQRILDLSAEARRKDPTLEPRADYYELPYRIKERPGRVLVVGAGTGNDVAAGLRRQAGHIDAVEIDPTVLQYGKILHPEKPYQDPRVEPIVQDARTFIRQTDRQYDMIVYGLLDSHTLLSNLSSVRLDSFVYTVEGFREARARLSPKGVLSLTFCVLSEQLGHKFYLMLKEAFDGQEPRVFRTKYDSGLMFVVGPGVPSGPVQSSVEEVTEAYRTATTHADVSTDDWPFLYMPVRQYPVTYVIMVAVLVVASLLVVYQFLPLSGATFSPACFFLGAGFMLIETKGITELGLLFGNTWYVISVVIAGILIMAFLANLFCQKLFTLPAILAYALLLGAIGLGLWLPQSSLAGLSPLAARLAAAGLVVLPLFFSGFAFSGELKRVASVPAALSSNLLGAMLGGFCEYNSMYFGFRSLSLFASVLYGLAFVATLWVICARLFARKTAPQEPAAEESAAAA
ncbi:MAG TPA: hypothetical protein VJ739_06800 [Gemmataceae bacterium]|nr:hypothetical protein [Gemmataceae bacterium]